MQTTYSQIHRAEACLRKFAWGACEREYEPQRKSGADGDELHAVNEAFVKYGMAFPDTVMGRLAAMGAEHLPTRADDPMTEIAGEIRYGRHVIALRADVAWIGPSGPIIMDYKSVKHFGFVPPPARLRMDLQAVINCYWVMKKFDFDEATAVWLFYRKPDPNKRGDIGEVKPVECTIDMDSALRVLRSKQAIIDQMEGLKQQPTKALNVVGNPQACKEYGGCWYRHKCFPDQWMLDETGTKSIERGPEVEYREERRARV